MKIALLFLFLCISGVVTAAEIVGKVVRVSDGDTIVILTDDKAQHRIRLAQIDAPESKQPWGAKSKQALIDKIAGKMARVAVTDTDRYGRSIGTVFVNGVNINTDQVARGNAWVYRQYLTDMSLLQVEKQARESKRGLWALPDAQRVAPWEWRKRK